jgi:hypothetical protein
LNFREPEYIELANVCQVCRHAENPLRMGTLSENGDIL